MPLMWISLASSLRCQQTAVGRRWKKCATPPTARAPAAGEVAAVRMFSVTADDGHEIRIRGYWPTESRQTDAPLPAIVFAHGGSWVLCSLALYDNPCRARQRCRLRGAVGGLQARARAPVSRAAGGLLSRGGVGIRPGRGTRHRSETDRGGRRQRRRQHGSRCNPVGARPQWPCHRASLLLYPALDSAMDSPSYD